MNEQKKAFAYNLLHGLNQKDAAIKAGYSAKSAKVTGSRLASDREVKEFMAEAQMKAAGIAMLAKEDIGVMLGSAASEQSDADARPIDEPDSLLQELRDKAVLKGSKIKLEGKTYDLTDPKDALTLNMMGVITLEKGQQDSAKALLAYVHGKIGEQGKKGAQEEAAQKAVKEGGIFTPMAPPTKKPADRLQ